MGSADNFCLRWNDFETNISTSFRELRDDSEFFDVTLCCDNGTDVVQAHKVILAACSPLFRRILSRQKSQQHPFLYLKGIRLKELQAVLNFMYHGEVNVAQDALNGFLAVAEELAVKGLTTDTRPTNSGNHENSAVKKTGAKRKSAPTISSSGNKKAKPVIDAGATPGDVVDVTTNNENVDVKGIKAEPEPSGSGPPVVDEDSFAAGDNDEEFGAEGGDDFEGYGQYGDDFDDSAAGMAAAGTSSGDGSKALEEARFTKSQFGKAILVDSDGYRYSHSRMNDKRVYWRCVYYMKNRGSCPGKAVTEGFFIRQKSGGHLHKPMEPIIHKPHGNSSQAKRQQL